MVKPPRTMEPSAISDMSKAGRDRQKAFGDDSFHVYMARKIDMQRNQFGNRQLPPSPLSQRSPSSRGDIQLEQQSAIDQIKNNNIDPPKPKKKFGVEAVLKRLQQRYGLVDNNFNHIAAAAAASATNSKKRRRSNENSANHSNSTTHAIAIGADDNFLVPSVLDNALPDDCSDMKACPSTENVFKASAKEKRVVRPDLFFYGIVVLINGYTNPDAETLQRLLQRHGGDVERYETSRITHIIAERLSKAKANVYMKQQRNPKPVCRPQWITDSVQAYQLLPCQNYIIDDVKRDKNMRSVASMFHPLPPLKQQQQSTTSVATKKSLPIVHDDAVESDANGEEESQPEKLLLRNPLQQERKLPSVPTRPEFVAAKEANEERYIHGNVRTVGTDPNFLESFFASSRLSFIGSYRQRKQPQSPLMKRQHVGSTKSAKLERYVCHVDMDCFFAAVVLRNFPQYRDQPVAISHHSDATDHGSRQLFEGSTSECATCNYIARQYGVKKGMFLSRAKALCPDLIVLPYDYEGYEEVSDIVSDILDRYASELNGYVEHVSCDEAYMEIFVPCDDESKSSNAVVAEVADSIRQEIFSLTQCTASVGVATNKFLAKLATDHVKPNRSFVMDDFRAILKSVKLRELFGIGYRMGQRLDDESLVSVQDIWDLGDRAESELCTILGAGLGKKIHGYCYGKDDRRIQATERKTIGAECNYGVRFDGPYDVDHMIEGLCKEVEKRMSNVGVRGMKVTLKVKQRKSGAPPPPKYLGHGSCHNLSKSVDVRAKEATRNWKSFFDVAMDLFRELKVEKDDVRGMGIVINRLVDDASDILDQSNSTHPISKWFSRRTTTGTSNVEKTPRKVDFVLPAHLTDIDVEEIDDNSENSDIICIDSEKMISVNSNTDCNDIALPALSQIHMSQVNALPSPLRKQIALKMENGKSQMAQVLPNPLRDVRYRQTDVKRMLRLASVKAGTEALLSETGQAISLTQLEFLPLELQLEIANEDSNGYGNLSPVKKSQKGNNLGRTNPSNAREKSVTTNNVSSPPPIALNSEGGGVIVLPNTETNHHPQPNFFQDNVRPLIAYLTEHSDANEFARQHVAEFLCICVTENRLSDAVVLLHEIKKCGNVAWSSQGFESIFEVVDRHVLQHYRANLDKDWILQL